MLRKSVNIDFDIFRHYTDITGVTWTQLYHILSEVTNLNKVTLRNGNFPRIFSKK